MVGCAIADYMEFSGLTDEGDRTLEAGQKAVNQFVAPWRATYFNFTTDRTVNRPVRYAAILALHSGAPIARRRIFPGLATSATVPLT